MKLKKLAVAIALMAAFGANAQVLPSTDLLTGPNGIDYPTPNTWVDYTLHYTPTTTGANYVGFAFRQDPAYWTLGNVVLSSNGGVNLLINGNFATGGSFNITTTNGPGTIQAPQYWGVWYQNGTYPAAAGSWYAPGTGWNPSTPYTSGLGVNTSTAGSWIDGAVGSFDGIYQGVNLTAGTLYDLSFSVYGNNATYSGAQIGVYAGVCADATLAASLCTMPSTSGFTTLATPDQGSNAGQPEPPPPPPGPTTYSEVSTGNTVTSDTMASGTFTGNGGTLQLASGSTTISNDLSLSAGSGLTIDQNSQDGILSGAVSGDGSLGFINSGTGGSVTLNGTYSYTGNTNVAQGATVINNSDISSSNQVRNEGTFTNNGTVGTVINFGSFTNNSTGVTGTFNNAGSLVNYGTVNELGYNNYMVENYNTINSITYNGGYVYNYAGGTIGSINNTEAHGYFNNQGTVTGDVTTNSTFENYGNINGTFTNNGNLTHYAGSINALVNNGTFTTGSTTLGSYTQSSTGVTNLGGTLLVTGAASLDGTLNIQSGPTVIGKYTLLSAGSRTGQYATVTGADADGSYLKYTATGLDYWITPNSAATQSSINQVANSLGNAANLQSGIVTSGLGNDCNVFGETGTCVSVNVAQSKAAGGDLQTGGITLGKRINNNWRAGVFVNSPFNSTTVGQVGVKTNEAYGGYVGWNKNADGTGLGVTASAVTGKGNLNITRNGPEVGTGTSNTNTNAYQVKLTYATPVSETVTVTPYVGVRYSETGFSGYTEQGPIFPLTVNSTRKTSTDVIAGVGISKQITDKLSGNVSAGIVQKVNGQDATFAGTSEIKNLSTFSGNIPSNGTTNPIFGAGLSYSIDKTTKVGVSTGWQAKGSNAGITSVGFSITKGF